jgi:hypothetical protein
VTQFLEVIEEWHFRVFFHAALHNPIGRVTSRAPAPPRLKRDTS